MCRACELAAEGLSHEYRQGCQGCRARSVARSPWFSNALKDGRQSVEYRSVLGQVFVTHAEVKAAAAADRGCDQMFKAMEILNA